MTDYNTTARHFIAKSGTMNLMSDKPYWWVAPAIVFTVLAIAAFIVIISFDRALTLLGIFVVFIICLPADFMFLSARTGKRCRYEADDEKLTIYRREKPEEIYYSEVLGVKFEPFYMILGLETFNCGYKVTIKAKFRTIVRYYAFNGAYGKNPPADTPFWILVINMPEDPTPQNPTDTVSLENYYENAQKKEP